MRTRASTLAGFLLFGALLNLAVAWVLVAAHGRTNFAWRPYLNPRPGDPVAFFVIRRTGTQWVVGCGRPGTLIDRHPDAVALYAGPTWWPSEAVTFDDGSLGAASGWPLLSFSAWRTVRATMLPGDQGIEFKRLHHWGLVLRDTTKGGWHELPAILPLRPIWPGFVLNTLLYAVMVGIAVEGWRRLRRFGRLARCPACAYPASGLDRSPECGGQLNQLVSGMRPARDARWKGVRR